MPIIGSHTINSSTGLVPGGGIDWTQLGRSKWPLVAALGAGCLVGASGLFLVQRLSRRLELEAPSRAMSKELTQLHSSIQTLQESIREIKEAQSNGGRGVAAKNGKATKSALRTVTFSDVEESFNSRAREDKHFSPDHVSVQSGDTFTSGNTEYFSADEGAFSADEFFDLPQDDLDVEAEINNANAGESDKILELFRDVDDKLEGSGEEQEDALRTLREHEDELNQNGEFLWRLCKAVYLYAINIGVRGDASGKKALIDEACELGKRAVDFNCNSSEGHKWYAIVVGSRSEYVGTKEKIEDGYEFKRHIDRAAELAPHDHTIQHLLGRFCYEVAALSWWEKKMAATLFAEVPSTNMDEAREHFANAERLKPDGWKENRQFLAKSLVQLGEVEEAVVWLERAASMPVKNPDDEIAQEDIEKMLSQYKRPS